jgi:hypothetical protein
LLNRSQQIPGSFWSHGFGTASSIAVKHANRQSLPICNVNLREMRFTQLQQPMYFDSHRLAE